MADACGMETGKVVWSPCGAATGGERSGNWLGLAMNRLRPSPIRRNISSARAAWKADTQAREVGESRESE